jgi:LPS sulfotransferase NodH
MAVGFTSFVILAGMRTGSNLLEAALASVKGITCYGEAFNPAFIGGPRRSELLGMTRADRERDPLALLSAMRTPSGLAGFRFFHDHDPRVLAKVLGDHACAKIVLSRNPVDSYLSLGIARMTGQWRLSDLQHRKSAQPSFDAADFDAFVAERDAFHRTIVSALQVSGQTAFFLDYSDLRDTAILNGLLAWLGVDARIETLPESLVVQNPGSAETKTANPAALRKAVADSDPYGLSAIPVFEPRRGPMTRHFVLAGDAPVLYQPVPGVPDSAVRAWLRRLGSVRSGLSQAELKEWLRCRAEHISFTLVAHPVQRAWAAYSAAAESLTQEMRAHLSAVYGVRLVSDDPSADGEALKSDFQSFLKFLKGNLGGQTGIPVRPEWASQCAILDGFRQAVPPRFILRTEEFADWAKNIAEQAEPLPGECQRLPEWLAEPAVDKAARHAYARDFLHLGFGPYAA